ncbi:AEC family transporter [Bifidobacterium avesanii]|uniref:Transporter n=1 Tax=Bifidobacterium avesanii TaxID=1798157 RepID=A0A7K3TLP0_9BIFI|nr:transporter [Bifidobacterium avesanii]KAB8288906.1 transporter [Bifidobacterium avesanii]NEG79183.1 transporter [Bifidobacterium avesanii]
MNLALQTGALMLAILMGYAGKRIGVFGGRDYKLLQTIIFNVTLPAAVILSFAKNDHDLRMFWVILLGFLAAFVPLLAIYFAARRAPVRSRGFQMLVGTTFNVGSFALPAITTFLGAGAGVAVVMFDIGNAMMCAAGALVLTNLLLHLDPNWDAMTGGQRARVIARNFYSSVPFDMYLTMIVLLLAGIAIPGPVVTLITPFANANTFLSMIMVGMMMEVPRDRDDFLDMAKVLGWRLLVAVCAALAAWYLLPLAPEVRMVVAVTAFAPISIFSTKYADETLDRGELAGFSLTVSALISLVIMAGLCAWLPTLL